MLTNLFTGFGMLLTKLLPLLQLLLELFQPGDGKHLTREQKIITLCYLMLVLYGFFVSYAYVVQYHGLVEATSRLHYLEQSTTETTNEMVNIRQEKIELSNRLFNCLESRSYKQPIEPQPVPPTNNSNEAIVTTPPTRPHRVKGDDLRRELLEQLNNKE